MDKNKHSSSRNEIQALRRIVFKNTTKIHLQNDAWPQLKASPNSPYETIHSWFKTARRWHLIVFLLQEQKPLQVIEPDTSLFLGAELLHGAFCLHTLRLLKRDHTLFDRSSHDESDYLHIALLTNTVNTIH